MRQLLRNIAEIGAGQGAPQGESNYCDYGIPFVKAGNLQELTAGGSIDDIQKVSEEVAKIHKLKLYPKGTVLFAKSGMSCLKGYVYTLPQDAYVVSHLACITPKEDISEYLRLYFTFHRPNQLVKDAAYPSISLADIGNLEIDTRDEQTREHIILTLRSVEEIIAIRKQELSVLDDLIKARFVEMFGDIIRNNKGWPQYVFSDIATSRLGKMLDAKQQTGKYKYPYLANFNVQWFRFELENLNEMDFNEADQVEFQLNDGDLLVCEGGEIGRCAVWHNEIQPCYFQKALHRVRCNTDVVLPDYLARWFQYNCEHGGFASIEGAKATIAHLPGAKLKMLKATVPPIELQERFVSFVAQIDKSKVAVQAAVEKVQLLFDSLMQQYFG